MSETTTKPDTREPEATQPTNGNEQLAIGHDREEEAGNGMLATWHSRSGSIDNFQGDDVEKFKRRMVAMNDTEKGGDHLGKTINLKHWMVHEVQIVDKETGAVSDCCRAVLVDADGTHYAFVSEVVAKGLREIWRQFGTEVLDPPLPLQVKQKATGGGRRCYVLVPMEVEAKKK